MTLPSLAPSRIVVDRVVLDEHHDTPYRDSAGKIPRQDTDGNRSDTSMRWHGPAPASFTNTAPAPMWFDATVTWDGIFIWSNADSGRYMNYRKWCNVDRGAPNRGDRDDMSMVHSERIPPGFVPVTTRHKSPGGAGYTHQCPLHLIDPGQDVTVWVGQSIEIDADAPAYRHSWYPTVRHFDQITVMGRWWPEGG